VLRAGGLNEIGAKRDRQGHDEAGIRSGGVFGVDRRNPVGVSPEDVRSKELTARRSDF